jgi:hypothetical protein
VISLSNDRPNVALSVREQKFPEESKADLRFLIPRLATTRNMVPLTAIYCNQRLVCEDACDIARFWARDSGMNDDPFEWITFYHVKVGSARKREIEEGLRKGDIQLVFCTEALGMVCSTVVMAERILVLNSTLLFQGCDFRNIERVVLWGVPPSFCSLAQRAGRAARDMTKSGEAILFVSSHALKKGVTAAEVGGNLAEMCTDDEAGNIGLDEARILENNGISEPAEQASVDHPQNPNEGADNTPAQRRFRTNEQFNSRESQFLSRFIAGKECRCQVWNIFFGNNQKSTPIIFLFFTCGSLSNIISGKLEYPTTTLFQPRQGLLCCNFCSPEAFQVPKIITEKPHGLARGRKKVLPVDLANNIKEALHKWRKNELFKEVYGSSSTSLSIPPSALLTEDVIEKIISCGVPIRTAEDLRKHVRWYLGFDTNNIISRYGTLLLEQLAPVYDGHLAAVEEQTIRANLPFPGIPPEQFYSKPKPKPRPVRRNQAVPKSRSPTPPPSPGPSSTLRRSGRLQNQNT